MFSLIAFYFICREYPKPHILNNFALVFVHGCLHHVFNSLFDNVFALMFQISITVCIMFLTRLIVCLHSCSIYSLFALYIYLIVP